MSMYSYIKCVNVISMALSLISGHFSLYYQRVETTKRGRFS